MRTLTSLKVALAAVGLVVWGYGVRVDDPVLRWVGIALFAGAVLMRFLSRRRPPGV